MYPIMSVIVVSTTEPAIAGSIPKRLNMNGMLNPAAEAQIKLTNNANATKAPSE